MEEDFDRFDYVLAMDNSNLSNLIALAGGEKPDNLYLFLDFDEEQPKGSSVPDPYYGGGQGFEHVLDLCQSACEKLLEHIESEHDISA